jgi:DNA-binding CsgD family transcriptional regulator
LKRPPAFRRTASAGGLILPWIVTLRTDGVAAHMGSGSELCSLSSDAHRLVPNRSGQNDWPVLDALIGDIYECALDPALWDDTLTRLTAALSPLEWDVAFLIWEQTNPPLADFVGSTGLAVGIPEIYSAVYAANNPWSQRMAPLRSGSVVDTDELIGRAEFAASPLYRDFLQRWGIGRALAVMLDRRGAQRLALVLPGPPERDLTALKRGLRILAPHIQRAVRISHRIATAELRVNAAENAADRAVSAILCLRPDLSILTANRHVASYVERGVIRITGGVLSFVDAASQRQLLRLAHSAPPMGAAFATIDQFGGTVAAVAARIPTQTARALGGKVEGTGLIVSLGGSAEPPTIEIDRVAAWFGLTAAEARLATAVAAGSTLSGYAAARNVSVNAARFLLKGVFRKTEVGSQAQLVALFDRLPK